MLKKCILVLLLIPLGLMSGCDRSERRELPLPPAGLLGNTEWVAAGEVLFAAHCAECHGSIAEGRTQRAARFHPAAPDFHEQRYQKSLPGYLYKRIEQGRNMEPYRSAGSVMPPWGIHFSEEQIWSLVTFIRERADTGAKH